MVEESSAGVDWEQERLDAGTDGWWGGEGVHLELDEGVEFDVEVEVEVELDDRDGGGGGGGGSDGCACEGAGSDSVRFTRSVVGEGISIRTPLERPYVRRANLCDMVGQGS